MPRNAGNGLSFCHWNIQRLTDPKFEQISKSLLMKLDLTASLTF